jgi:hypothetical protein
MIQSSFAEQTTRLDSFRLSADLMSTEVEARPVEPSFSAPSEPVTTDVKIVRHVWPSPTLQDLQNHPVFGLLWQPPPSVPASESPLEKTRNQRLAMLVKQFEGTAFTREDKARLAILTQRLRRLAPRVSSVAWTKAEDSVTQMEAVSARIDAISDKYGL